LRRRAGFQRAGSRRRGEDAGRRRGWSC